MREKRVSNEGKEGKQWGKSVENMNQESHEGKALIIIMHLYVSK